MGAPKKMLITSKSSLPTKILETKKLEEKAVEANDNLLDKPPKWLRDARSKKEWKRLVGEFKPLKIINNLDYNNLAAYCNAFSFFVETTENMKGEPLTKEYTNKFGATNEVENPIIKVQMKYSDEMRKYASLLGLTVDSRLKMATIKVSNNKNKISDEFGDI